MISPALGFKVVTHDLCPPIQGGPPIWTGALPFTLPPVHLDTGRDDCGQGWNYCEQLSTALRIAGLWPNGRPSRGFLVEPGSDTVSRGDKRRASSLTMLREATEDEILAAVRELSEPFGEYAERMAEEQMAWRSALARAEHDAERVAIGLRAALTARGLDWGIQKFPSAWAVGAAWDAWAARDAWDAWAARDARDAWAAWDAWDAWAARDARAAWDAWDAWAARIAWDAWDALTVTYAGLQGWIKQQPELLTIGIRDAYGAGLAIAVPVGPKTLGYAMVAATGDTP